MPISARISLDDFGCVVSLLGDVAKEDIEWAESIRPPDNVIEFALEAIFVICNSGMKNTVARGIFNRVTAQLMDGKPVGAVFGHKGKVEAIERIWRDRDRLLSEFLDADDRLAYCASLPFIGNITKYHLAKNFGVQCAKPDVHLQRLADREGCTPQDLCERLAAESGYSVATVDTVLWRACANGVINSRTGEIASSNGGV